MKFLKGWKTRIAAGSLFVLGMMEAVSPSMLTAVLGNEYRPYVVLAYAVLFYALRQVTDTPAGKSK